ncbi:MAG TPA: AAA domain-containing protein, partial [Bryobacterales bacterium]|nr:AAA domain-containing protein [Bryobacterales bacterium]
MDVLRSEMAKRGSHMAIRDLLVKTGPVVQKIKPVFLMSPLSVAQFLAPGTLEFDLVVFDEASQVKVVDSYGAIVRGERLVVVGDSKQLPPTDFFESLQREQEEEHAAADIESLLKKVESRLREVDRPMLRWHYRSRHESLIAFSNRRFYENRLVVFPSSVTDPDWLGLSLSHIPTGVYGRGEPKANNPVEARHVAEAVMEHARRQVQVPTDERESLMVATFSAAQRDAVDDAIEIARRQNPSYEEFFTEGQREPFEVKNLESVQGDERDVVFISVGYGRDKDGRLTNNFGPVNSDGGDRRLNVLCSRARNRCVVFTNFLSSEIAPSENLGVSALKAFLAFAETGDIDDPQVGRGDPENEFERSVREELVRCGHTIDAQVGCAGYRIDLAVRDASRPGRYLLGIECDGAMYHSAKSARDRDRLRQEVLESRGWRVHRIWSTSWFRDPEKEIQRAIAAIEEARTSQPQPRTLPDLASPNRATPFDDGANALRGVAYQMAVLRIRL